MRLQEQAQHAGLSIAKALIDDDLLSGKANVSWLASPITNFIALPEVIRWRVPIYARLPLTSPSRGDLPIARGSRAASDGEALVGTGSARCWRVCGEWAS